MKPYVLVSLWAEDDHATRVSHEFAMKLNGRRAALHVLDGDAPSRERLRALVDEAPEAAVVIFGHGGAGLSARSGGEEWISPSDLAAAVPGRRVYAFACDTFVPQALLVMSTFAEHAVQACVGVFVGHQAKVMTPLVGSMATPRMDQALFALIERFIDGEDDAAVLKNTGRMGGALDLPIELDLPSEDPGREGALGWSSAGYLQGLFTSLRVRTKGD